MKEEHGVPGDGVHILQKGQAVFFQKRHDVNAVAFHAGMHFPRHPAGEAVQIGAALADGAGLGGENVGLHAQLPHQIPDLIGELFMLEAGIQGFLNIGDIRYLHDGADHQAVFVA